MRARISKFLGSKNGTAAVEFAFVGPVFMMCMVGMVYVGMMLFSEGSLQYAVEQASRCEAVNANLCGTTSATRTYAQTVYYGPSDAPAFEVSTQACGFQVKGSASMTVNWVLGSAKVPLKATACFP